MDVLRLGSNLVSVDGLMVHQDNNGQWSTMTGNHISSVRLTSLFKFIHEEIRSERKRFHNYVDNILYKLIYN